MPTELLLTHVDAGKTEYVLEQIHRAVETQPFAPIWVLLPGTRQEDALRQRLVEHTSGRRVYFNVTFFSFYTLYARLLDIVGKPQRELDDTGRVRLIRGLLTELQRDNQLSVFHRIADKAGFAQVVADFIYELKQNVIYPDPFAAVAKTGTDKDRDLARIYTRYQDTLRNNNLVDREGEGWLALDELKQKQHVGQNIALMVVDGFDQFNPLQAQLLALLAGRVRQMLITLPEVEGRENTVGRRFTEAHQRLTSEFAKAKQPLVENRLSTVGSSMRHAGLQHLTHYSFINNAPNTRSDGCVKFIEAPDPKTESFALIRQIKQLMLDGCTGDEILIAVRDWTQYALHLNTAAQRYGIPVLMHTGDALANNPVIIALLNLLELARYGFQRRAVLDVLRSPYFVVPNIDSATANQLDIISREQQIIKGQTDWLAGIQASAVASTDEEGDQQEAVLTGNQTDQLKEALRAFFEAVTPAETASIQDYIQWIEMLVDGDPLADEEPVDYLTSGYSLQMLRQVNASNDVFAGRDLLALQAFKKVLKGMLATEKLMSEVDPVTPEQTLWNMFISDLKSAIGRTSVANNANRTGRVLVTSVTDARGLPHEHVFIPGLAEGIFPRPTPEDLIYLDSERRAQTQAGIFLETQAERAADDGLFYELISLPRKTLTLSRPTVQNGAIWPESHLWRAVKLVFSDADTIIERHKIPLGGTVRWDEVSNRGEAALAVAESLSQGMPDPSINTLYNWLLTEQSPYWRRILQGRQIEQGRMTSRKLDHFSGRLHDPQLLEWVAAELGEKRIWSASQFNDYGLCGFRFFAKRLLKLEAVEEPESGMDAAQRGTVVHAILEETYRQLGEQQISIVPENLDHAMKTLRTVAASILPDASDTFGFRESPLWLQEQVTLMRKIEALVRADFSEDSPLGKLFKGYERIPYKQEMPLGGEDGVPLQLRLGDSEVRVTGYIDRIDRIGDQIIVVDYKTGSTKIPISEMVEGRNFQMMIYLLAVEKTLATLQADDTDAPTGIAGGTFWHLNRSTSGDIHMDKPENQTSLEEAQTRLGEHLHQGRAGNFASVPNRKGRGACTHYCEFTQFCRVSVMQRRKQL